MKFRPTVLDNGSGSGSDFVSSTVRIAHASREFRIRSSYKHDGGASSNSVDRRVATSLYWRPVTYLQTGMPTTCGYPLNGIHDSGYHYNVVQNEGPQTRIRHTTSTSTEGSWSSSISAVTSAPTYSYAYDLELRAYSGVRTPAGAPVWTSFDNLYIEEQY